MVARQKKGATLMYCKNCGKEVNENAAACLSCGADPKKGNRFCPNCGVETNENQVICTSCGVSLKTGNTSANGEGKSKVLIGVLACVPFVSNFGIHYYLFGAKKKFKLNIIALIISAILTVFGGIGAIGFLIIWIINLIFGIRVLTGKFTEDENGNPLT